MSASRKTPAEIAAQVMGPRAGLSPAGRLPVRVLPARVDEADPLTHLGEINIDELGRLAREAATNAEGTASRAVEQARRSGLFLLEAKARVPHGEWDDWIGIHFAAHQRTAQRYMALAKATAVSLFSDESPGLTSLPGPAQAAARGALAVMVPEPVRPEPRDVTPRAPDPRHTEAFTPEVPPARPAAKVPAKPAAKPAAKDVDLDLAERLMAVLVGAKTDAAALLMEDGARAQASNHAGRSVTSAFCRMAAEVSMHMTPAWKAAERHVSEITTAAARSAREGA